jgi:Mrp family chromosome partitioning ATPase
MGRMLETLKLGDGRRAPLAISMPVDAAPAQDCVVDWEISAEVPYIEVGGPNKKVDLSPSLMKHPPQAVPQPPHLPSAPPTDLPLAAGGNIVMAAKPATAYLTPTKPMAAEFEPWPAPAPMALGVHGDVIAFHQPDHPVSKEYATLLDTLCGSLKKEVANVLLFVGLKQHVGASTVLLNLAVTAALKQKSCAVVVDGRGGLAERLGRAASVGLAEVMAGTLALEHATVQTGIASLHLLPAGAQAGARTREALAWLFGCLRERYELIFVHGPNMEDAQAAELYVPHANGIYLVLPQGEPASGTKGAAQTVSRMGGRLSGLIHTHFEN